VRGGIEKISLQLGVDQKGNPLVRPGRDCHGRGRSMQS